MACRKDGGMGKQDKQQTARIKFGAEDVTVLGRKVESARRIAKVDIRKQYPAITDEDAAAMADDTVRSQAENERGILTTLLQHYTAKVKKGDPEALVDVGMLIKRVRTAVGVVELTSKEIDWLRDSLKKLEQQPEAWALYPELFEQLTHPQYKETPEVSS